jgi:ribose/xylose/arabinose/galactoside ABC-type transport system permease subunit
MLLALRGVTLAIFGEETVPLVAGRAAFVAFGRAVVRGVPIQAPIVAAAFVAGFVMLRYTGFGRLVYAIGGSEDSARLLGVRVERTKMLVYAISGGLAGLAGVLFAARISAGITNYGLGLELDAITVVALGGTQLTGGVGGVCRHADRRSLRRLALQRLQSRCDAQHLPAEGRARRASRRRRRYSG